MITRVFAIVALCLCAGIVWAAETDRETSTELAPIAAVSAEQRAAEARSFIVDALWLKTEEQWHSGEWDEAIRICRQIVQIDPHFIDAYTGAAWMLWSMDRDEEAIALYREGVAANPKRHEVYHDFGMYYWHREKWDEAVEQFRKSTENGAPQYLQHMLPNSLGRAGRKQEALQEWRALLERFPDDPIAVKHIDALEKELKD
jgi:tetratricopeptide (TPR) repeat protein